MSISYPPGAEKSGGGAFEDKQSSIAQISPYNWLPVCRGQRVSVIPDIASLHQFVQNCSEYKKTVEKLAVSRMSYFFTAYYLRHTAYLLFSIFAKRSLAAIA
jgi:hypothetical protein